MVYTPNGLFFSQTKYDHDIVDRVGLLDCKPTHTPLSPNASFVKDGVPYKDPSVYRSLVGALQYLTITGPHISYAVNQVSKFLQHPTIEHFTNVKRIIRYVKEIVTFGLMFSCPTQISIAGYSDAYWARCLNTRRSTFGYSIFLGENLVSWSAKSNP
ncbi:uncharacterized mitochondrial protein AtMg00810-like [Helianthus annuus]|uniref:uncharacterized mitochondrial protein AtMg00810-like n=1 Tax=Helianthus annuus TaxID=4232 RepID=UPI000B8FFDA5|nr:uncharacterized mitochondrial protein AtMg00810-like [Helianthus annuus]